MLYPLVPESCGIQQWASRMIPQLGLHTFQSLNLFWMGSGLPWCMQSLGSWGYPAVNQTGQVECGPAAPLVAFPNTSLSHDDRSLACCFCHLVISMASRGFQWLCMWRACPQSLSPGSGQAQLHFLQPYQTLCFQNCYSATWGIKLDFFFPPSSSRK